MKRFVVIFQCPMFCAKTEFDDRKTAEAFMQSRIWRKERYFLHCFYDRQEDKVLDGNYMNKGRKFTNDDDEYSVPLEFVFDGDLNFQIVMPKTGIKQE